ncbi:arylsulfatase [Singulisphaera rosea]
MTLRYLGAILVAASFVRVSFGATGDRPNVVVIITDDQGYGDLSLNGNPKLRTPHLDRLASEGARFSRFYVMPVCAPTRACLLTGRYAYRTGVVDTYLGRAMMHSDEVTLAEMLSAAGYRTGIFGKWHLGDNYPLRPQDQGFQESLVLRGGGIGQPSDPPEPGGSSYFNPVLQHDGREETRKGYCSDVFTDAAIEFVSNTHDRPFFAYLAFNAPHTPLQVPEPDYQVYKAMDLRREALPTGGFPLPNEVEPDTTARVYGMVANIDANVGRLMKHLDDRGLARNTIVVFLTDNGPQQPRYNAGMRGLKGTVYEGGIRVPCLIRWPGRVPAGRIVGPIAGAVDLTPTLLDACRVQKPSEIAFDGRSLLPLLSGDAREWPERTLFAQWHRGDTPQRERAFAAITDRYKLLRPEVTPLRPVEPPLELYDLKDDPDELHNLAEGSPDVVASLRSRYDAWYDDVSKTRQFVPPRIILGAPEENPTALTRQDWRGPRAGWGADDLGYWEVEVAREGRYRVDLRFAARPAPGSADLTIGDVHLHKDLDAGAASCSFDTVSFPAGSGRLEPSITVAGKTTGAMYVVVQRLP